MASNLSNHIIPATAGIRHIAAVSAFAALSQKEKNYVYHFSRAAYHGAKICYFQRSYESPART